MVATHYRWDFIGLSTDTKPTPETSEKVVDGSTFYCSDNSKLYVWCKNQWYEKEVSGGGGGTTYTAGDGIDITDDTISVDTTTIQPKLTAGKGIGITENIIWATGGVDVEYVDLTLTGTSPQGLAVTASKYMDEVLDLADGDTRVIFRITLPSGTGYPTSGTYELPLFNYEDNDKALAMTVVSFGGTIYSIIFGYDLSGIVGDHTNVGNITIEVIPTGGSGSPIHTLTSADFNWDSTGQGGTPNAIATWLLEDGWYIVGEIEPNNDFQPVIYDSDTLSSATTLTLFGVFTSGGSSSRAYTIAFNLLSGEVICNQVFISDGTPDLSFVMPIGFIDDVNMAIEDMWNYIPIAESGAPDNSRFATLGQFYTDIDTMHTYQCTAIDDTDPDNPVYTWTQRW